MIAAAECPPWARTAPGRRTQGQHCAYMQPGSLCCTAGQERGRARRRGRGDGLRPVAEQQALVRRAQAADGAAQAQARAQRRRGQQPRLRAVRRPRQVRHRAQQLLRGRRSPWRTGCQIRIGHPNPNLYLPDGGQDLPPWVALECHACTVPGAACALRLLRGMQARSRAGTSARGGAPAAARTPRGAAPRRRARAARPPRRAARTRPPSPARRAGAAAARRRRPPGAARPRRTRPAARPAGPAARPPRACLRAGAAAHAGSRAAQHGRSVGLVRWGHRARGLEQTAAQAEGRQRHWPCGVRVLMPRAGLCSRCRIMSHPTSVAGNTSDRAERRFSAPGVPGAPPAICALFKAHARRARRACALPCEQHA